MNRRHFMSNAAAAMAGSALFNNIPAMAAPANRSKRADQPNVILILVDDLGWDEPGCYGGRTGMKTPNIDRLAKEGIRFTHATGASMCSPSRAQLITGRYGFRTGMNANAADPGGMNHQLNDDEIPMPQTMKSLGYTTGLFGKLHLHWNNGYIPDYPETLGFDEYFYYCGEQLSEELSDYWKIGAPPGGMVQDHFNVDWVHNGRYLGVKKGYDLDIITDKVNEFIDSNKDKPFFAYVPQFAIHEPFQSPDKWKKLHPIDEQMRTIFAENVAKARIRGKWLDREGLINYNPPIEKYQNRLAMASALDDSIGRILTKLEETGLADNTIVIVTSDNGPHPIAGGGKADMCDMAVRVPLIIRWPKKAPAGQTSRALVDNVDIYPTLVEAAGRKMPDELIFDGISFYSVLKSPQSGSNREYGFACLKGRLGLYDHNWFYEFAKDGDLPKKMWTRITPPNSIHPNVPLDLVPEQVKQRFAKKALEYREQWTVCMTAHIRQLEKQRKQNKDGYGDRHEMVYGFRR